MKNLLGVFLILLAGCGSGEMVINEPAPTVTDEAEHEAVSRKAY